MLVAAASLSLGACDAAGAVGLGHASHRPRANAAGAHPAAAPDQTHGLAGTAPFDVGLYTAFCPHGHPASPKARTPTRYEAGELQRTLGQAGPMASAASTSEAGWPAKQCLKMDKGRAGGSHTLVGLDGMHNWLLGGYGNDTIIGGNRGDVIWADYHPSGQPGSQTAVIHAGNGRNVIYANDTHNYVWTGTNPYTVLHAHVSGISGVIHCQSPYIVVYLSTVSERRFKLDGCRRVSHYSVGY
jgi:Ca2+-binding RTX toxin-like protein